MSRIVADPGRLSGAAVLVLGDAMLDRFVYGTVSRISPEAPIPVLSVRDEILLPGGAANVALNAAALGARVTLVATVGGDDAGLELTGLLAKGPPAVSADVATEPGRLTTVKTRYIARGQQIMRADRECIEPIRAETEEEVIRRFAAHCSHGRVVAISDYGKGVLTDRVLQAVIRMSKEAGAPVVVDPKRTDWSAYRGAAVIKPNLKELSDTAGVDCGRGDAADRAAERIVRELGCSVLLTRSEHGMTLYRETREPLHVHALAHEVADVSGAGDTALAAFATAWAAGWSIEEAVELANLASGIAVTKVGTAVVTQDELRQAGTAGAVSLPPAGG
jgi:D-beta-D-heptose 7-phosphate kinase/D-beta-D-heptose 1-phosphate adenosyltransferase